MLVQRQKEIDHFKPEPYWELHTTYREVDFAYVKGRFQKREDGEKLLAQVQGNPFEITKVEKKNGREYAPPLFDLTSLQVHCNKRFGLSAEQTLKIAQRLYEQKIITYPRTDTTYLPNDQYPKIPGILGKLTDYATLTAPLLGVPLRKSGKVFNDKKVTDHHAIIPTGQHRKLSGPEFNVYDAVVRRFIAVFYPDCEVAKTLVLGESNGVEFKTTGKVILKPGWRVVLFPNGKNGGTSSPKKPQPEGKNAREPERELPPFKTGETGSHEPALLEKMTQPPKYYTEATLLRAMETAGKQTDDRELRELMKANGIGRPSTRAAIIETLFRRKYIRREKKQLHATETGIALIDVIQNDLLKSVELTGQWEKQLRDIEAGKFSPKTFVQNMKQMVEQLVVEVRKDQRALTIAAPSGRDFGRGKRSSKRNGGSSKKFGQQAMEKRKAAKRTKTGTAKAPTSAATTPGKVPLTELNCPKCGRGKLLRGSTAYGCSCYKSGCSFRLPFEFLGKKISDNQLRRLIAKGSTVNLKGFDGPGGKREGKLVFTPDFNIEFTAKNAVSGMTTPPPRRATKKPPTNDVIPCPSCGRGQVIRGKQAYGCTHHARGCNWRFAYADLRQRAAGRKLTRELVLEIFRNAKGK